MMKTKLVPIIFMFLFFLLLSISYSSQHSIRIGIYSDRGVHLPGKEIEYVRHIKAAILFFEPAFKTQYIKAPDIHRGALDNLDVIIFPGGSGGRQSKSLGPEGRKLIKEFVKKGGGYIGICGGAYLGQSTQVNGPAYALQLSEAVLFDKAKHWNRGAALARIGITREGTKMLPELKGIPSILLYFSNGPILWPAKKGSEQYRNILIFQSDIYPDIEAAKGETLGKTFLLMNTYGKGTVILSSGHPEATPGMTWILPRMVRWAAGKKGVPYPKRFINHKKYSKEIFFTKRWKLREKSLLSIIKYPSAKNSGAVILAVNKLKRMASRKLRNYLPALLQKGNPSVKIAAIETMIFIDNFESIPLLKEIYKKENNEKVKKSMLKALQHFTLKN